MAGGMAWCLSTFVAAKSANFLSQLALGWLLSKTDYAVYAMAISVQSLVAAFHDGGANRLLVQQGHRFESLAHVVFVFSLGFNALATMLLLIAAPFVAAYYQSPSVSPVLQILSLSIVLGTPVMVYKARLTVNLEFGRIARVTWISTVLQYGSMVCFALFGFGPLTLSFHKFLYVHSSGLPTGGMREQYRASLARSQLIGSNCEIFSRV